MRCVLFCARFSLTKLGFFVTGKGPRTQAKPSSRRKLFLPFFIFFVSSYVGYVPASDDLGIFGFVWWCEFSSKFLLEKFLEAPDLPKHNKF